MRCRVTGARGNSTSLVGTPETVAKALVAYYDLGATSLLIRAMTRWADAEAYGREFDPAGASAGRRGAMRSKIGGRITRTNVARVDVPRCSLS